MLSAQDVRRLCGRISVMYSHPSVAQLTERIKAEFIEAGDFRKAWLVFRNLTEEAGFNVDYKPGNEDLYAINHRFTMNWYACARKRTLDSPAVTRAFPYRMYSTVGNGQPGVNDVRPEHARLHGLVFAYDDPFWKYHEPPWDDGCRCYFRAASQDEVDRNELVVRTLNYVRNVMGIEPGPEEFRPSTRTHERVAARLDIDVRRFLFRAMVDRLERDLQEQLQQADTRPAILEASQTAFDSWSGIAARLASEADHADRESCLSNIGEHIDYWRDQLTFIKAKIAEEAR